MDTRTATLHLIKNGSMGDEKWMFNYYYKKEISSCRKNRHWLVFFFFFNLLWKIVYAAKDTNSVVIDRLEDHDPTKGPFSVAKSYFFIVIYIALLFKCWKVKISSTSPPYIRVLELI